MKQVTPQVLFDNPLPTHEGGGDKQERGRVLVIAGSVAVPGAALLAGMAALRAGAGILQIATCQTSAQHIGSAMPEAMVIGCAESPRGGIHPSAGPRLAELASDCDALLIGPGMTDDAAVADLTFALLKAVKTPCFVIDAAAFTSIRDSAEILGAGERRVVVTPHSGEMAKFLDIERYEVDDDPLSCALKVSKIIRGVVALKGATTHIVGPLGEAWVSDHGCIGLATSGSGDTLAGILSGLLARGTAPLLASLWSVYMHAEAGRRLTTRNGGIGFLAREIPGEIPRIMADLSRGHKN